MLDYMLEEPLDEIYQEECKFALEYDQFMKDKCKCQDEYDCMTFEEFVEYRRDQLASYWLDNEISHYEEGYA